MPDFDIIVVGGGHAGIEAAWVATKLDARVLLITLTLENIGQLSCNPSMGGLSKSQVIKDIDALGGLIGYISDKAAISYRTLNKRKGPAMHSTRAQVDRTSYRQLIKQELEKNPALSLLQDEVVGLIMRGNKVCGVKTKFNGEIVASAVILAPGTFPDGIIHIGETQIPSGRAGESSSVGLSSELKKLSIRIVRFKTGTPPRLDGRTVDFSAMQIQSGENDYTPFSIRTNFRITNQLPCYITYTDKRTHKIIRDNLHRTALYSGRIKGKGPRYCPSIEDKVVKFANKDRHQLFLEPEGLNTYEYYLNGASTSLPVELQIEFLHTIKGLENCQMIRPAYAIEYDCIDPTQLKPSLESKTIMGLFFAGQVNGTSGYEEAAGQGLVAGLNAALYLQKKGTFVLSRSESYIGVMIDDIVKKGVDEPYRLFTARAEHRLILREDNALRRLSKYAENFGLLEKKILKEYKEKEKMFTEELKRVKQKHLMKEYIPTSKQSMTYEELLRMPGFGYEYIVQFDSEVRQLPIEVKKWVEVEIKYSGYIEKDRKKIREEKKLLSVKIPNSFNYQAVKGLTGEGVEKFLSYKPFNLKEASLIPGVRYSDILLLYTHLRRGNRE